MTFYVLKIEIHLILFILSSLLKKDFVFSRYFTFRECYFGPFGRFRAFAIDRNTGPITKVAKWTKQPK